MTRKLVLWFFVFFLILPLPANAQSPIKEYQEKVLEVKNGAANGYFPDYNMFPSFIYTCHSYWGISPLKIYYLYIETISLVRSGYNESRLEKLRETIKSLQERDGSFPAVPLQETIYYPWSTDGMTFEYCESSKAGSTALALLALLEAGENPNSEVIQKGVQYLLETMKRKPYYPDENVSRFVPGCYGENWTIIPCRSAFPSNATHGAYWTTRVCRMDRGGFSVCIEVPGVATTAYATALLHKLGYDVRDELKFLQEYLTLDNLINRPLSSCCIEFANISTKDLEPGELKIYYSHRRPPKWWWREDLAFPVNDFDYRDPYESLALPLLYLREEGLIFENNATRTILEALKESQKVPEKYIYLEISGYKYKGSSYFVVNMTPLIVLNGTLREDYQGEFYAYYGFKFPNESIKIEVRSTNARAGAILASKVDVLDTMFMIYSNSRCNKEAELSKECFLNEFPPSILDYSWSSDVYSTAVALIWLYASNETTYEGFQKAIEYLGTKGLKDGSRSFDGYAYALIALSLYSGDWERNRPEIGNDGENTKYLAYILVLVMILSVTIGGYFLWRSMNKDELGGNL
ncbi:hypothetical protein OCC_00432 [Thermococcus litoralis DSM 5473]|uniref:Squalene cyclase C-terminal domain-containing protein n=1 Tax=Thermococcus litoralis (strain ATCC 51850 / DSM 5473 / JCM 8560 / NS-C) TaxID=523849 RepID=H3ZJY7_THELN|nr:hypothetical protein [Thermococcus litoralis]EHR79677.1 hypothetical protein OCC_00432 [Thermococcus litoralis DSM 5473]